MNVEGLIKNKIDILNELSLEEKKAFFTKMNILDLKSVIELVEEGEKND